MLAWLDVFEQSIWRLLYFSHSGEDWYVHFDQFLVDTLASPQSEINLYVACRRCRDHHFENDRVHILGRCNLLISSRVYYSLSHISPFQKQSLKIYFKYIFKIFIFGDLWSVILMCNWIERIVERTPYDSYREIEDDCIFCLTQCC